jgi:hypothetical protein
MLAETELHVRARRIIFIYYDRQIAPLQPLVSSPVVSLASHCLSPLSSNHFFPSQPGAPHPGGADINLVLDASFVGASMAHIPPASWLSTTQNFDSLKYEVNGATYSAPDVPILLQILNGVDPAQLMPNSNIYRLALNKSVEISWPGGAIAGPHPLHLHGVCLDAFALKDLTLA